MLFNRRTLLAALAAAPLTVSAARALRASTGAAASGEAPGGDVLKGLALVMFEQSGCPYCAAWNRDIAPAYAKTDEGKAAPLFRRDIHHPIPAGMVLTAPPQFTPTFVLLKDGHEVGRIQGNPGPDFFWPLLDGLLKKAKGMKAAPPKA